MTQFISKINENTSLPLKVIAPVVVVIVGALMWLNSQFASIGENFNVIKNQVGSLQNQVTNMTYKLDGTWTVEDQELWATRMQVANPSVRVPNARDGFVLGRNRDAAQRQLGASKPTTAVLGSVSSHREVRDE